MFSLINLPYAIDALEPVISARTLEFHHGKHLQGYVDNLNKLIVGTDFENLCHSERSEESGICHSERSEESLLLKQITTQWGTLAAFQKEFETKGAGLFGSGWVWLQADAKGELSIAQYAGADNPVAHGLKPILTFDVWEHAYYLDYQNRRPAHLAALWNIVDWIVIERRFKSLF